MRIKIESFLAHGAAVMERLSHRLNLGVEKCVMVCGAGMALIVILQVFCRYVLNNSLFWSEELARYLMVWLTFLGASVAYRRGVHPGIDLLYQHLPAVLQKTTLLLVHLISLSLFGIMIIYGVRFSYFVRLQISPSLGLPKWIIMGIIPVSGLFLAIHGVSFCLQTLGGSRHDR